MTLPLLLALVPLLPALLAPLLLLPRGERCLPLAPWVPLTALPLLALRGETLELPWLLLETRLGLDPLAFPLLLLAIAAWFLAGWHARRTLEAAGQARFFFFWLLTWCGNLSVLLTLDAASFYAAYALVTFSAYGLVVHRGRPKDLHAGRVYLWMSVIGEGMLLAALLMLVATAGNLPLGAGPVIVAGAPLAGPIAILMLAGFGIKVGLAGLHMWLPLAHPRAPVPASAVLSGVILKAGLIGWLRFLPLGQPGFEALGQCLAILGFAGALGGVAAGYTQRGLKSLLAYSSVSQMGILCVIVSLALLDPERSPAYTGLAVLFALHHGLNKAALFVGVDIVHGGRPPLRHLLWLPAAALAALPFTAGALVKGGVEETLPAALAWPAKGLTVTSAATALLLLRFLKLALREQGGRAQPPTAPLLALLALGAVLPWAYAWRAFRPFADAALEAGHLVSSALPALAGVVVWLALERAFRARRMPEVAPGDLLHLWPGTVFRFAAPRWPRMRRPASHAGRLLPALERGLSRLAPAVLLAAALLAAALLL